MSVVISTEEALSLGVMLGTVLTAIVDAQAQSARATVEFINAVGFLPEVVGQPERLRTVKFAYSKLDENQQRSEFAVEMPLLGLVDIPLVSVKKATISFAYEIVQATAAPPPPPAGGLSPRAALLARIAAPATLKGRVAEAGGEQRARGNLQISIDLEKAPMPVGLDRLLDILQVATAEAKTEGGGG